MGLFRFQKLNFETDASNMSSCTSLLFVCVSLYHGHEMAYIDALVIMFRFWRHLERHWWSRGLGFIWYIDGCLDPKQVK